MTTRRHNQGIPGRAQERAARLLPTRRCRPGSSSTTSPINCTTGRWWASPASKPVLGPRGQASDATLSGKGEYLPIVSFASRELRDLFSDAVVAALRDFAPAVFADEPGKMSYRHHASRPRHAQVVGRVADGNTRRREAHAGRRRPLSPPKSLTHATARRRVPTTLPRGASAQRPRRRLHDCRNHSAAAASASS